MKLIIGLGNPGKIYQKTRHNIGFSVVDEITSHYGFEKFEFNAKFNSEIAKGSINGEKIIVAKPQTFMNNSGNAVRSIVDYYKLKIEDLIVIHDDLDIKLGEYRISRDRNSAGHNGVQSIIDRLGTKGFERIRIGIGVAEKIIPTEDFVLSNFQTNEQGIIDAIIDEIALKIKERV
ncbi:MAG: aminoacyl-tRNA hydrolase [Minisyncoccia bacterium]